MRYSLIIFDLDGTLADSFPFFLRVHDELAAGATLALVTSNAREVAAQVLGAEAMALFAQVDCGASIFGKARRLRRLLATTGIAAADAIYIGDQVADAEGARDAGVAFGAVDWGYAAPETLAACHPAHRFHTVNDLENLL